VSSLVTAMADSNGDSYGLPRSRSSSMDSVGSRDSAHGVSGAGAGRRRPLWSTSGRVTAASTALASCIDDAGRCE
jgi:hypothetical protein